MSSSVAPRRYRARTADKATGSVTIDDVARMAGVSRMTVSRSLNKPELVNAATLEQVRRIVERTGYVPNLLAGGLVSRRSRMVAAIVPSISNSIFIETVQALTDDLWTAGYQVMLGLSGYPPVREEALLTAILSRRPDAVFLTGISHSPMSRQRLLAARIPVVETWDLTPSPIDMLVGFSHEKVGAAVAEYLIGKGYRKLALLSADDERAGMRRDGFARVAAARGLAVEVLFVPAPSTMALGRQGLLQLLQRKAGIDAVFCSSDTLALGALQEARKRNIDVPKQLAIVGFGGLDFTEQTVPALSSVAIDGQGIGQRAARLILDRIAGRAQPGALVDVGFQIAERETS